MIVVDLCKVHDGYYDPYWAQATIGKFHEDGTYYVSDETLGAIRMAIAECSKELTEQGYINQFFDKTTNTLKETQTVIATKKLSESDISLRVLLRAYHLYSEPPTPKETP